MFKSWSPLARISFRNGVIAGLLGSAVLLGLYFIGKHPMLFNIFFDFRILLFAIFMTLTLKEIRDNYQDGIIFFWQGMIANLIFTAVFSVLLFVFIWLLCQFYEPFLKDYITNALEQLAVVEKEIVKQLGKKAYDSNFQTMAATNGYVLAKHYFWQSFIISLFLSIIISVILRRQPTNN
jgi:hypothetical protein